MRHIVKYTDFIFEQDMAMDPNAAAAPVKEKEHLFVFLEPDEYGKIKKKTYPDGSSTADYPTYSATEAELADWAKKNVTTTEKHKMTDSEVEVKRKNLVEILIGKKQNVADSDLPFLEKIKNAAQSDMFGSRKPDTSIFFTKKGVPTTHNIEVTFITLRK